MPDANAVINKLGESIGQLAVQVAMLQTTVQEREKELTALSAELKQVKDEDEPSG